MCHWTSRNHQSRSCRLRSIMATKHHAGPSTEEAAGSLEGLSLTQSESGDSSFRSIPSRKELLEIIRKHSSILGQAPPSGTEEEPVDPWFWREILDMFFVRGFADKKTPQDDDLLYFVRITDNDLVIVSERDEQAGEPYFVRRFAPNLDKVIGTSAWEVDWCRSVYLNLIQHTAYSLTVAICNREVLQSHHRASGAPLTPMYKVTKTVYASPTRTNFQSDNSKASETQSSYPDICFSVDDFANTFEAVVLSDSDQCLCVLLDACGGAALAREEEDTIRTGLEMRLPDEEALGPRSSKVTLFSGFVSYSMVRSAFENGRTKFGGLHLGGSSSRPERLIMRGPGGRGEVDVAVSSVPADDEIRNQSTPAPPSPTKPGVKPGLGTIVWKAALAASTAARNAVIASSNGGCAYGFPQVISLAESALTTSTVYQQLVCQELRDSTCGVVFDDGEYSDLLKLDPKDNTLILTLPEVMGQPECHLHLLFVPNLEQPDS